MRARFLITLFIVFIAHFTFAQRSDTLKTPGLQQPVEVLRDHWGVAHIYAKNEHDLFFAQGYVAAQDRLFQLELWRRQATGTVSEILGPRELKRDQGVRLFKFRPNRTGGPAARGDLDKELKHYHPRGPEIIGAFVDGINAYVATINQTPDRLPLEFKLLNTKPGFWTPEVVISRHQGLLSNIRDELNYGRLVHLIGAKKLRELNHFHPAKNPATEPNLTLHVAGEELMQPILALYEAFRLPLKFSKDDAGLGATEEEALRWFEEEKQYVGSNNWVVAGQRSASGKPLLANDPHRAQAVPSLRYWVHLSAPGWNVVGAGEPTLPGVSIGHNDHGAWGLTIFDTDNEDLYVYDLNPANPDQYRYRGRWEDMQRITDTIAVKGERSVSVMHRYTRHGPVVFVDSVKRRAYAVRAGWRDAGGAPYLASLRMNQARSWAEFRQACTFSAVPGENMVWAGRDGTIGWQAVGRAPIRKGWTGLMPVPGDGRFEWAGYLPVEKLPHSVNPKLGFLVTANNNLTPADFPHRNAIGWVWAGSSRADRIAEVLAGRKTHTMADMQTLQADYVALPARQLVPLVLRLPTPNLRTGQALDQLRHWNYSLDVASIPATIYVAWEGLLRKELHEQTVPYVAKPYLRSLPTKRVLDWLTFPDFTARSYRPVQFIRAPLADWTTAARDTLLLRCLDRAVADLSARLGPDMARWQYGQVANKHIQLTHPLSNVASKKQRERLNVGPAPRGGYGETVNVTGSSLNQEHGASFRILVDTGDWDQTLGINTPGQSGDAASPHYADLFPLWAKDGYFPVYFSRKKVETVTESRTTLRP